MKLIFRVLPALLLTITTLLTGCGGSSSGSTSVPDNNDNTSNDSNSSVPDNNDNTSNDSNTGGSKRILRTPLDFDNNGVEDASVDYSYDTEGHLIGWQYSYTGDGVEDKYNPIYESRMSGSTGDTTLPYGEELIWNNQGVLTGSIVSGHGFRYEYSYNYVDGKLSRVDSEYYNEAGALLATEYQLYSYSGEELSKVDTFNGTDNILTSSETLTYNVSGQVVAHTKGTYTMTFTWNEDGSLSSTEEIELWEIGGSEELSYSFLQNFTYTGGLTTSIFSKNQMNNKNNTATISYEDGQASSATYDLNSDGSIEAVETIIWESGNCILPTGRLYDILYPGASYYSECAQ